MKRIDNLYQSIISIKNLEKAFTNAKKGKLHYKEVKIINKNKDIYLSNLYNILKNNKFINSEYIIFKKNCGIKIREIYKLPFYPDRIVHHAIIQILQPIFLKLFIRNTFSTIPKRGIHDGVERLKNDLKNINETKYCLKLDIKKYYPSIDHTILKNIIRKKIKDIQVLNLLDNIIDSAPGIPIGNYISQWFGNLYLTYFDHYCKEILKCKYYYRYCDDIVILSDNKNFLHDIFKNINTYLIDNLKLTIKSNWQIFPVDSRSIDFLGYKFYHTHTLIRKSIVKNFKNKIKNKPTTKQIQAAYWGWFKHANSYNLTKKYFKNESRKNKITRRNAA